MMIFPLLALAISSPLLDDSYEENDTCAKAAPLTVPADGTFHEFAFVSSGPASPGGADEDWFRFDVPAGHALQVLTLGQFAGDPGIDTFLRTGPQCGTILASSVVGGPFLREENTTGQVATYQVQFRPVNPLFDQEAIRLRVWIAPIACPGVIRDAFEPNQVVAQAAPMPSGLYRGLTLNGRQDRDYYQVAVPTGGVLEVGFGTQMGFASAASCTVRSLSGGQQIGAVPSAGGLRSFVNTTNDAFLIVDVELNNPTTRFRPCAIYDLYVNAPADPCAGIGDDVFESQGNDKRDDAILLSRGRFRGLTVTGEDDDWFSFDVPPGFGLKITVANATNGDYIATELMEDGDARVYQRNTSFLGAAVHHYGNPDTSAPRRVDLLVQRRGGPFALGCARYDMGVQIVREIPTQPLCTGSPDLQWGEKTVDLFGSVDPNVGLLWVTVEGLEPGNFLDAVSIYVGVPIASPPAFPTQSCVVDPRVRWDRFNTSLNRHDSVVDETYLAPLMGTTLAVQYFGAENGLLVASDTVTFVVQ